MQYESNVTELRIEFDEGWDNYAKTVTFWNALMANPVKRILTTNLLEAGSTRVYIVPIPGEALTEAGDMTFVIDGYAGNPFAEGFEYLELEVDIEGATNEIVVNAVPEPAESLVERKIYVGENVYTIEEVIYEDRAFPLLKLSGEVSTGTAGDKLYPADGGRRKRSVSAELWVNEAPYEEDAEEPASPTPSEAEQLQEQIDNIIDTIDGAKTARDQAQAAAQQASTDAGIAAGALAEIQGYDSDAKAQAGIAKGWADAASTTYTNISTTLMPQINTWHSETKTNAQDVANAEARIIELEGKASTAAGNAASSATTASEKAKYAGDAQFYAERAKTDAETAKKDAETAKATAETARSAAASSADSAAGYATRAETAKKDAETAKGKAEAAQAAAEAAADRAEEIAIGGLATEEYVNSKAAERVAKTGDSMTGILTFETPTLFSAFAKRRTINGTDYLMRVGIGNDGEDSSGTISLRLFTLGGSGIETRVAQLDIDKTGLTYTTPGGIKKTVAHSGNIGVLTASLEG